MKGLAISFGIGIAIGGIMLHFVALGQVPIFSELYQERLLKPQSEQDTPTNDIQFPKEDVSQTSFVGKSSTVADMKFTLLDVYLSNSTIKGGTVFEGASSRPRQGAVFLILSFEIENVGKKQVEMPISPSEWTLTDSKSRIYKLTMTDIPYVKDTEEFRLTLGPGLKTKHKIGYEIPYDRNLTFDLSYFGRIK